MRVLFLGTAELGVETLRLLATSPHHSVVGVVTQPDRPAGRKMELTPSAIKREALAHQLTIYQPEKINVPGVLEQFRYLRPDLAVVAAYGQILSRELLDLPRHGCLNLHASLLPKYRGASPIQAALLNGDAKTGMTIMWMDAGLDTGPVLMQESFGIGRRDNAETLHTRLSIVGAKLLMKSLDLIQSGKAPRVPQDASQATYVRKIKKEHGRIDWTKPQREIDCQIRAFTPWPSAYTLLPVNGEKKTLKIFRTIISNRAKGKPGEVVRVDKHGILVAAGVGGLLLREVQLEGKKRLHAAEFARGQEVPVGTILG
jgi:methionyl-tRNA formyltransferase